VSRRLLTKAKRWASAAAKDNAETQRTRSRAEATKKQRFLTQSCRGKSTEAAEEFREKNESDEAAAGDCW
jgi:hypothetical protein